MAGAVRCPNSVPGYKGNGCRGHKWIPAFLKPRGLVKGLIKGLVKEKGLVKGQGQKDKGRRGSVRLSAKRGQVA